MKKPWGERIAAVFVLPDGAEIYSEMATKIQIVDEGAGEFLEVSQKTCRTGGDTRITIEPEEWPALRQAIDKMIGECRSTR
jgi:hypothetical protein